MGKHYSYGSGMVGCLYDNGPHFADTLEGAIECVLSIFDDLPESELKEAQRRLKSQGIYFFRNPQEAGADYCEVVEQDGPCPEDED